jgi:hypothetical protein
MMVREREVHDVTFEPTRVRKGVSAVIMIIHPRRDLLEIVSFESAR